MDKRILGNGLEVSEIGLGCMGMSVVVRFRNGTPLFASETKHRCSCPRPSR